MNFGRMTEKCFACTDISYRGDSGQDALAE